jgi:carboxyl-terminal processing protease
MVKGDTSKPAGKAYKTPGGRTVYGGGGITPDVFVPYDTTHMDPLMVKLYYKGTINNFVYRYYLNNRNYFNNIKTPTGNLQIHLYPVKKSGQDLFPMPGKIPSI